MMLILLLAFVAFTAGNPATLQQLYEAPTTGGHHHHPASEHGIQILASAGSAPGDVGHGDQDIDESIQSNLSNLDTLDVHRNEVPEDGALNSQGESLGSTVADSVGSIPTDAGIESSVPAESTDIFQRSGFLNTGHLSSLSGTKIVTYDENGNLVLGDQSTKTGNLDIGLGSGQNPSLFIQEALNRLELQGGVTLTQVQTVDVFKTISNLFYNSIPVTLTQFVKTTVTYPTTEVVYTATDDLVFIATVPVTRTDTITVTDTNTLHQCATEVSTDRYTITHQVYDIRQQVITSTVMQTQVYRPTVVSTKISTEYETETVLQTVTNTVYVELPSHQGSGRNPPIHIGGILGSGQFGQSLQQAGQFGHFGQQVGQQQAGLVGQTSPQFSLPVLGQFQFGQQQGGPLGSVDQQAQFDQQNQGFGEAHAQFIQQGQFGPFGQHGYQYNAPHNVAGF